MKLFKTMLAIYLIAFVTGCANNSSQEYYVAMQQASVANAQQQEARYRALATVAQTGDPATKAAATMAIALTQDKVITPQYIEDPALKWASVLAAPVAAVAGLAIQADVAKNASDNSARVQLASFQSNENIQLGQQQMLVDALGTSSAGTTDVVNGMVTLGVAGFDALNVAGSQTADVATVGLNTADSIATGGFSTLDSVATTGFATVDSVATTSLNGMETVSLGSQTSLVTLGVAGLDSTTTVGLAGIDGTLNMGTVGLSTVESVGINAQDNLVDLGTVGMTTLNSLGQYGLDTVNLINTNNNALVEGITTDYNQVLQDYNATMQTIATDNPDVCVVDPATGTATCN